MSPTENAKALGYEGIGKLLFEYSMPAIVGTTAMSLYNIIDRIFIGHGVGPLAISGLALTLPVMNLGIAFGALVGAGAATLVSIRLGEKRGDEAVRILGNTVLLNVILSVLYSVVALIFLDPVLALFGASKDTLPYARDFLQIILVANVFQHLYMGLNSIMRASGYPRKAMATTLMTVGVNVLLAPLFIFTFKWGIRGAALATVTAQLSGLFLTILHFSNKKNSVHFLRGHFTLDLAIIRDIFAIGMSPLIFHICACLIAIIMNLELVQYGGDYAVGAFGVINSVLMCVAMIVFGLTQGMQPIAGYNYGARQFGRATKVFKYTIIAATCVTTFGFLIGELFPWQISFAFTDNRELLDLTVSGMRYVVLMFPLVGFQIVTANFFQSIGRAKISIGLSLSRQVFFLIPSLLILPRFFGLAGVWSAIPLSDFLAAFLSFVVLKNQVKKIKGFTAVVEEPSPLVASEEQA